jgi:uncharacterized small protein (TIGR04563 family)
MASTDKRKQSLYFPEEMLHEIHREAVRLDRSFSWVVQKAWEMARTRLAQAPTSTLPRDPESTPDPRV